MPEATKRILTDETGQDIVSALQALTNVVDPNGTTVAAALKLNNMTTSVTILPAGATPTSSLTEVDGHFHLTLGIPLQVPVVTSTNEGEILKVENGQWTVGEAPTGVPDVTSLDDGKVLQVNNGEWTAEDVLPTTMTGATLEDDGEGGLVPAPTTADVDKFLSGDGTYKSGGLPMVILSYGHSTWQDFMDAYRNNVIVYCRASSQNNPGSGSQTRMGFMAYVNNAETPTEVEFQYYRSTNPTSRTVNSFNDQVYVYKLESKNGGTWTVTAREAGMKSLALATGNAGSVAYDKNTGIVTLDTNLPAVTSADDGKVLKVVNGVWTAVTPS